MGKTYRYSKSSRTRKIFSDKRAKEKLLRLIQEELSLPDEKGKQYKGD